MVAGVRAMQGKLWSGAAGQGAACQGMATPSENFTAEWRAITEPHAFPAFRRLPGLGFANVSPTIEPHVMLLVFIKADTQGEGKGTRLLKIILDLADRYGVTLECCPSPVTYDGVGIDSGPKADDLVRWYEKHGFTEPTADGFAIKRVPRGEPTDERAPVRGHAATGRERNATG